MYCFCNFKNKTGIKMICIKVKVPYMYINIGAFVTNFESNFNNPPTCMAIAIALIQVYVPCLLLLFFNALAFMKTAVHLILTVKRLTICHLDYPNTTRSWLKHLSMIAS